MKAGDERTGRRLKAYYDSKNSVGGGNTTTKYQGRKSRKGINTSQCDNRTVHKGKGQNERLLMKTGCDRLMSKNGRKVWAARRWGMKSLKGGTRNGGGIGQI